MKNVGFSVHMDKVLETELVVQYSFGPPTMKDGLIQIDKKTGAVTELQPSSANGNKHLFVRAAAKIHMHWGDGLFPDQTEWAS